MSNILQMLLDCRKMMLITIIFTIIINTIAVETTTGNRISSMKDSPSLSNDSPLWRYLSSVPSDDLISIIKAIERNVTVDDSCRTSLERFRVAFERKEWWIAEWIDSFGRPESGLLTGNSFWTGNQFECERLPVMLAKHNQPRLMPIATSYCVIDIAFLSSDIDRNDSSLIVPKSNVRVGSCLPGQCSLEDLNQLYVELVKYVHTTNSTDQLIDTLRPLLLNETRLQCNLPSTLTNGWFTRLATAAFVLMFTASVLISCSSTVWFSQQSNENDDCDDSIETKWIAIFKSFDLVRNFNRLFSTAEPNKLAMTITPPQPKPSLNCLNGIRVLSIQWVMLAHVLSYSRPVIKNASQVIDTSNSVEIHLIGNAGFAVDTFFTLSGLLLSYHFFRRCDNRTYKWTPKSLGAFYVGRYVRLTVVYAVVLMFYLLIADQLASGPNWLAFQNEVSKCKHDFWKNLLYINNISSQYYDQCMVWTWYLANDFQFHLIAPLCLMFLQRRRWQAWLLFAGIVLFSWIINFYLSVVNQLTFPEPLDLSEQTAHKYVLVVNIFNHRLH